MIHPTLEQLRRARGFEVAEVAAAKIGRLTHWLRSENLDAAVVGVSGGVDSALVLALLRGAQESGALRRVIALLLPIEARGATNQAEAASRGRRAAAALGAEIWEAPLAAAHGALVGSLARASGLSFDAWSEGQALAVVRTPALYGAAALLQAHGLRSIVVGTTNRDEGAYLGFFGKASDGMVDLQPIADLHKSEVRALARHLGVPSEIVDATPRGDVHDGRTDEEMIGATYDEVELFLRLRELGFAREAERLLRPEAWRGIEAHHTRNRHKYAVGSPAVHLDVFPRGIPEGGARDEPLAPRAERRPPDGAIPGAWDPPRVPIDPPIALPRVERLEAPDPHGLVLRAREVLTRVDCMRLREAMAAFGGAAPVGVTGVRDSYGVGSTRATAWSPELARDLWAKLAGAVPSVRFTSERTPTDAFATPSRLGHRTWRVVGLSPLLRFMRYDRGGRHLGHYDAAFDYGDGRRTLMSVVLYLTDAPEGTGGATRFLRDGQERLLPRERRFDDWDRDARREEVAAEVRPIAGDALLFDHRLCHDVEEWRGEGPRVIIRGDVVYEAVPDGRA
ncbi:MAG: NAD(+) synthase [Deltaproteobacteria bacterium]|nr:NAD(+) synthase [Deltaproteobacteria bacterium]